MRLFTNFSLFLNSKKKIHHFVFFPNFFASFLGDFDFDLDSFFLSFTGDLDFD